MIAYAIAANSIGLVNEIGVKSIQTHNQQLSRLILDSVPPESISSPLDLSAKGGTTVIDFSKLGSNQKEKIPLRLRENGIHFDSRKQGFRFSPHIYNTREEVSQLIELLTG